MIIDFIQDHLIDLLFTAFMIYGIITLNLIMIIGAIAGCLLGFYDKRRKV